jgi:hypothetical protein
MKVINANKNQIMKKNVRSNDIHDSKEHSSSSSFSSKDPSSSSSTSSGVSGSSTRPHEGPECGSSSTYVHADSSSSSLSNGSLNIIKCTSCEKKDEEINCNCDKDDNNNNVSIEGSVNDVDIEPLIDKGAASKVLLDTVLCLLSPLLLLNPYPLTSTP